jgi:formate C-acetyltransferase
MGDLVTLSDLGLRGFSLRDLPLVNDLRDSHLRAETEVCIERAALITEYLKQHADAKESAEITRARAVAYYLSNRIATFHDANPIAGATTSKQIGAPVYPEFLHLAIWPELDTISTRTVNPQLLTDDEKKALNFEIFPFWMNRNVLEVTRKRIPKEERTCLKLLERIIFYISGKAGCISHCIPSYQAALDRGLQAVIDEVAERKAQLEGAPLDAKAREKRDFYQAVEIALGGILAYAKTLSEKAAELEQSETDPGRKEDYRCMAKICARVPAYPPRSFREAVNSLWLCQVGIHAENVNLGMSPGRLDQVLYPFYARDVDRGELTVEEALRLSCCLWLKLADNTNLVPETAERLWGGAGSTPAVTLGGVDSTGSDAVNDLTYILLRATELMTLRDPNLSARFHYVANERRYLERVCDVIVNTRAIPALHNDVADIDTLQNQGETPEHARDYGIVGCVELASPGRDYCASSSIMLNLGAAMEMTLLNGKRVATGDEQIGPETGDPAGFTSFAEFWTAFETQLRWLIGQAVAMNEHFGAVHQEMVPTPLLSAFFEGCLDLENARDLVRGGAIYNSSGASHVAFPDVCDSLNAIEFAVFQEQRLSMGEMVEAIKTDFADSYHQHLPYLKNRVPKFGSEHPIAVKNSHKLVRLLYEIYQSRQNYRRGPYRPAYWTTTTHAAQGKLSAALPSGRRAGEVFSSGITPVSQAAQDLVVAYNAVASLPGECIPGGEALNIKYTPPASGVDRGSFLQRFADLVEGYFRRGGLQVQYNIRSYQDLIDAQNNPDKDPYMIVRVSGYSAYFNDLNDAMKRELIIRTQYDLRQGTAVLLP